MANKLTYQIDFQVNKSGIDSLKQSLDQIGVAANNLKGTDKFTQELQTSTQTAEKLKGILNTSWDGKLNQLDLSKLRNNINTTYGSVTKLRDALGAAGQTSFNQLASNILNTNKQLKESNKLLDKMAETMGNTIKWGISSSIFNSMASSMQQAWSYSIKLDESLNNIRIVTGKTADEMERFAKIANTAAGNLGASTTDYTDAALIYYQQGLSDTDAQARAETTIKTANVTGQSGQEVSEQLTAVWNGYKVSAAESELYIDKLAAVAAATAADLEELSTGMGKVASAANLMGVDIDQLNATLATVVSVTRQAPESVGTAFKTIYARMGDIEAGLDTETTLGNYTSQMEAMGFNVLDMNGNLRDMGEVMEEVGNKWTDLSREQQIALSQTMAGTRQYNNLLSLFDNWDMYTDAINTSANAAGTLEEQQNIYMDSTEAHLEKLTAEFENTYDILFDTELVNGMISATDGLLSTFNKLLEGIGGGANALAYFGSLATKVFSKQISGAVETQIRNFETIKKNLAGDDLKSDIIAEVQSRKSQKDGTTYVEGSAGLDKEVEVATKIQSVKGTLSDDEYTQLTSMQQQLGMAAEQKAYAEGYRDLIVDIGLKETALTETIEKRLDLAKTNTKETKENIIAIENGISLLEGSGNNTFTQQEIFEGDDNKLSEIIDQAGFEEESTRKNLGYIGITDDEVKNLKKIRDGQGDSVKAVETLNKLYKIQNKQHEDNLGTQDKITDVLTRKNLLESDSYKTTQQQAEGLENTLDTLIEQEERQAKIQQNIELVSGIVGTMSVLQGMVSNIFNPDLTGWQKFESMLTGIVALLPQVITIATTLAQIGNTKMAENSKGAVGQVVESGAEGLVSGAVDGATSKAISKTKDQVEELGEAGLKASVGMKTMGASGKAATTGLASMGVGLKSIAASAWAALAPLLPFIAAAAAIAGIAYLAYMESTKAERQLNEALEAEKQAGEHLATMQSKYDELNSTIADYQDGQDAIAAMTKGTDEWTAAVVKLNAQVLELIKQYPDLMQHLDSENGVLTIEAEGLEALQDAQLESLKTAQSLSIRSSISAQEARVNYTEDQAKKEISEGYYETVGSSSRYVELVGGEELLDIFNGQEDWLAKDSTTTNDIVTALESAGVSLDGVSQSTLNNMAESIKGNADEILGFNTEIGTYTDAIGAYTEALVADTVSELGIEDENVENIVKDQAADKAADTYNKKLQELKDGSYGDSTGQGGEDAFITEFKNDSDAVNAILGEGVYDLGEDGGWFNDDLVWKDSDGKDSSMTQETLLEKYAQYLADQEESKNTTDVGEKVTGAVDSLNEQYDGMGTFLAALQEGTVADSYTQEQIQDFYNQLYGADFDPNDTNIKALGLGGERIAQGQIEELLGSDGPALLTDKELKANQDKLFDDQAKSTARGMEVDENAFTSYIEQLEEDSEALEENEQVAIEAAKAHFTLNKQLSELGETIGEDVDLLHKLADGGELTTEEWEKVGPVVTKTQEIFGDHVDTNFVTDNLDDLLLALEGNEDAFNRLAKKSAEQVVFDNFDVTAIEDLPTEVQSMMTLINDMDMANIEIGTDLDTTSMFAALREMILATGMSAETANALLSQIGYEPEVTMEQVEYTSKKTAENGDITYTYTDPVTGETVTTTQSASGSIEENGMITVPVIGTKDNPVEFKGTGAKNLGNNSPSSSGGGSSSKPKKQERREGDKDVYHDVNIALKQISNELDRIKEIGEEAFGEDLLKNYIDQYVLLNQELDKTAEKIRIAEGEQQRLQNELSAKGVTFNTDGTMANYFAAYDTQLAQLNSVIDHYNTLSADGQEAYQDTLDQANEDFDKFVENMSEYDDTVTDLIPGLKADMEEVLNQQIELQIEAFNMEIELRLDLFAAEQDWNDFKNKIIKGIEEDDIFGNAFANLNNLNSSFFNDDATGIIQTSTDDLQKRIDEVELALKADGGVYGDHHATALENLQEYYEELMGNLEEVYDISEEIRESYVDMMDEAQDSFDKQVEAYENVRDLLQHDMDIISMIYGEESYMLLSDFYIKQEENNNKQLDFQRQQVELWRQQMDAVEEGSEEWDVAKENWLSAVSEWNSAIQDSIQNLEDKYLNTINAIFQELNNNMTNDLGLEHTGEEWDLINQNADRYLDSVNSIYETQKLADKYQQSIDEMSSITAQKQLNDLMNEEIKSLQEKDKLSQYDIDRADLRYQIALKQIALEEAQQSKSTMRLKRDTQGNYTYQYVADDDQLATLQNEMSDLYNQLYNLDADQYQANLDEIYSVWDEFQNKMFEAAQINDPELRQERELLLQEQYGELINGIVADNEFIKENLHESTMSHLFDLYNQSTSNYDMMTQEQRDILDMFINEETNLQNMAFDNLFGLYNTNLDLFNAMTDEQNDALMNSLVPTWDSGVQQMIDKIAGEGGFEEVTKNAFEQIAEAQKQYQEDLKELQDQAGQSFEELSNGINGTIDQSLELIDVNDELIDTYAKELDAIAGVIEGLDALEAKYADVAQAAKDATTEAYELWAEQQRQAAEAAAEAEAKALAEAAAKEAASQPAPTIAPTTPAPAPSQPSLNIGSYVEVKGGTRWYSDSYGGGGSGTARSGSIRYTNSRGSHPYNIGGLGWIKKSDIVGFDTGGYTGDWDSSGKMAMLHQKELVLNAQDTENMLNTVSIVRSLVGNMGSTLLERLASIGTGVANAAMEKEKLEQNVQITAEFPNVKDASEIEEALNNLVNQASQEIYK